MKNWKRQLGLTILSLSTLCLWTGAYGQITPSGDANTNTASPTSNYGAKPLLDVESASQTTYIQFDLSSLPASYTSANITKATLKLYVNAVTTAGSFNVDFVNGAWSEKTITASVSPALGTTIVSSVPLISANVHDYIIIDITSAVGAWLNGTQANDGIALVGNSPFNASFDSKENTTMSHPPELDIVFAGGGTLTGITTAGGSGLIGGGTSGTLNLALTNTCSANQVLQWNGSAWVCAAVGIGTVTSVGSGAGLTGGPITGSGSLSIDTTRIPQLVANNSFTGNQSVAGNVSATGTVAGGVVSASTSFNIGGNPFAFGSYSNANAFLGFSGNPTTTGNYNTASGYQAFHSDSTGTQNLAEGYQALYSNTAGNSNTASGFQTLYSNTGGYWNTAYGFLALYSNTTGGSNTASGYQALYSNTTGSYNTASGLYALLNTSTATGNTANGYAALQYSSTGLNNTGLGTYAGNPTNAQPTTGSGNTYVGYQSNSGTQTNLNNATAIGANAEVDSSNALVLGSINGVNGAAADTFVGIGTTTPGYPLSVASSNIAGTTLALINTSKFAGNWALTSLGGGTPNPGDLAIQGSGNVLVLNDLLVSDSNTGKTQFIARTDGTGFFAGKVGIGTFASSNVFTIGQNLGHAIADGWDTYSSRRWKTNIHTLHDALAKVEQLRGVSYDLKESGKHEVGVIAEEVGAVVPEVVSWDKNGKDAQGVDYSRLTALLIEATKEQQALIRKQAEQIRAQQRQIRAERTRGDAQQTEIARLTSQVKGIQASLKTNSGTDGGVRTASAQASAVVQ